MIFLGNSVPWGYPPPKGEEGYSPLPEVAAPPTTPGRDQCRR